MPDFAGRCPSPMPRRTGPPGRPAYGSIFRRLFATTSSRRPSEKIGGFIDRSRATSARGGGRSRCCIEDHLLSAGLVAGWLVVRGGVKNRLGDNGKIKK